MPVAIREEVEDLWSGVGFKGQGWAFELLGLWDNRKNIKCWSVIEIWKFGRKQWIESLCAIRWRQSFQKARFMAFPANCSLQLYLFRQLLPKADGNNIARSFSNICRWPMALLLNAIRRAMGDDEMKRKVEEMRSIQKIIEEDGRAKYRIKRKIGDKDITFYIYFVEVFGRWKILRY